MNLATDLTLKLNEYRDIIQTYKDNFENEDNNPLLKQHWYNIWVQAWNDLSFQWQYGLNQDITHIVDLRPYPAIFSMNLSAED